MKCNINHSAIPAAGYVDPWSVKAGRTISAYLSCDDPDAQISVVSIDRDVEEVLPWPVRFGQEPIQRQSYELGSWLEMPADASFSGQQTWSFSFEFLLTKNAGARLVGRVGELCVMVSEAGEILATVRGTSTPIANPGGHPNSPTDGHPKLRHLS